MPVENMALIYPEPQRLKEIQGWLKPYASLVNIATFAGLPAAVPMLGQHHCQLLIVGDTFSEAQGVLLVKGLRMLCRNAKFLILAVSEELSELSNAARDAQDLLYFQQPWDQPSLMTQVETSIRKETHPLEDSVVVQDEKYSLINRLFMDLQEDTMASTIYLVTDLGQLLYFRGNQLLHISETSALLGASFAALQKLGNTLGELHPAANLIHRQSETEDLYAFSVNRLALLVLRIPRKPSSPRIGTVAYYTRRTIVRLASLLDKGWPTNIPDSTSTTKSLDFDWASLIPVQNIMEKSNFRERNIAHRLLNFEQAIREGLVTGNLFKRAATGELRS